MASDNALWEIIRPALVRLGLYTVSDPTFGRYNLPIHPPHKKLVDDPNVAHTWRRVFLPPESSFESLQEAYDTTEILYAEDVTLQPQEIESGLQRGGRWICYSIWEMVNAPSGGWEGGGKGKGKDLVLVHGLSDYGLRYAPHIPHFLKAGFRVIVPDLPSYGRSTGVHSFLPSLLLLSAALHVVLTDTVMRDLDGGRKQRKVFLSGASMGGWAVLYYLLKYPPTPSATAVAAAANEHDVPPPDGKGYRKLEKHKGDEKHRIQIAGAFVLCPMVEVSKNSRPSILVEGFARVLKFFAPTLPLAKAVRGNVSDDPRVEEDFYADVLCYHRWLRVGTGLALLEGMIELEKRAGEIDVPIRLVHGTSDRVTSHLGTLKLFDRLPNADKECQLYEGYEHGMSHDKGLALSQSPRNPH
ncbi:lysophospholipase [Tremella mesenterica]|uniref:Lysophospholipase n=1 Tax=Tremella mesenterica TaxID=5217 RepID=A0A4V1M486_TREME|nr:lysophospholipase [Tremella mesenterica]